MTKDLTRGTPWKLIVQFALPIMAGDSGSFYHFTAPTILLVDVFVVAGFF